MAPHPHTVFVNRPRPRARRPRLLAGSAALAAALLASLVFVGHWQAGAGHAGPARPSAPAPANPTGSGEHRVPAAVEVLKDVGPVPDEPVSTF